MKKKKTILVAAVLLLIFLIGGLYAYFTDTKTVTNTFTIGNVAITLTEPHWSTIDVNENNIPDAAEKKAPGETIVKDPTITNTGSNDAFIFAKVESACTTNTSSTNATPKEIFTYTINSGWILMTDGSCDSQTHTVSRVYAYGSSSAMTRVETDDAIVLFNNIQVSTSLTGEETGVTGNKSVLVTAYAIQADGLGVTQPSQVWSRGTFNTTP